MRMALESMNAAPNDILKERLPEVFSMLSARGREVYFPHQGIVGQGAEAKGKKINATIGMAFEDDGSLMALKGAKDLLNIDPQDAFSYAPAFGLPQLRKLWLKEMQKKNPSLKSKTTLPNVVGGLTHGLSAAGYLFVDPGDEVLMPEPHWDNYGLALGTMYGAKIKNFPLFADGALNVAGLKNSLSADREVPPENNAKKKIVLLNFPNNPTGYTPLVEEAHAIVEAIHAEAEKGSEVVVILDDAYFGLVYKDGVLRESLFALLADLHSRVLAVKVDGPTKEEFSWGFRVGFVTLASKGMTDESAKVLEDKVAGFVRGSISNASHPGQSILLQAMQSAEHDTEKQAKFEILRWRFETLCEVLQDIEPQKFFTVLPSNSGYFLSVQLKPGYDAEKVRKILLDEFDTGVIALGNLLRIAFSAVPEKDIGTLVGNLLSACKKAGQQA